MITPKTPVGKKKNSSLDLNTSKLLLNLLEQQQGEKVYLRNLLLGLNDRAFGWTLFICALPEALPLPIAGLSAIIGTPLLLVSGQLVLGFHQPWLPSWIGNRSLWYGDRRWTNLCVDRVCYLGWCCIGIAIDSVTFFSRLIAISLQLSAISYQFSIFNCRGFLAIRPYLTAEC
jgi:hypothetical protein